ncbi:MAG TPA: hypothetical protein VM076_07595 [Gemmatimonadaceae bacterium]|nr:hypothetical protein [Gemmatimonadaceae bacterium]
MRPRLSVCLPLILLVVLPRLGSAQSVVTADTVIVPGIPTAHAAQVAATAARTSGRERLPIVFYGVLGAAAVTSAVLHIDPDSGGYRDGWKTATDFPDKAVHALAAWAVTSVGVDLGVRPHYSALAVCAAGTAFEFAQGYVSVYDIAADCAGAAGAAAWRSWRARRKALAVKTPATVSATR